MFWCSFKASTSLSLLIFTTVVYYGSPIVIMIFCYRAMFLKFTESTRVVLADAQQKRREESHSTVSYLRHLVKPPSWWRKRVSGPKESFSSPNGSPSAINVAPWTTGPKKIRADRASSLSGENTLRNKSHAHVFRHVVVKIPHLSEIKEMTESDIPSEKIFDSKSINCETALTEKDNGWMFETTANSQSSNNDISGRKVSEVERGPVAGEGKDDKTQAAAYDGFSRSSVTSTVASFLVGIMPATKSPRLSKLSAGPVSLSPVTSRNAEKEEIAHRQRLRVTTAMVIIIVAFIVSFLPVFTFTYLTKFVDIHPGVWLLTVLMAYANSMYNPVLYGWGNNNIREGYRRVIKGFNKMFSCKRKERVGRQ